MRDINFYMDKAKKLNGLKSDLALNRALGFKSSMASILRSGKSHISDEKMIELAKLAGEDEGQALVYLNIWRAPDNVKNSYASILQKITQVTAMIIALIGFTLAPTPSHAAQQNIDNVSNDLSEYVYYGKRQLLI